MKMKNHQSFAKRLFLAVFSVLFACFMISAPLSTPSYALPNDSETTETTESEPAETSEEEGSDVCSDQSGAIGWIVCPGTGAIAKAIDSIYDVIERFLKVEPLSTDNTSTIHLVWEYARNITNIVFIIFILIVVWSQLTGIGIGNYGIKRVLPRIIIAAILVNLSFVICQAAVDISNILGSSLRGFFTSVQETAISNGAVPPIQVTWTDLVDALTGTGILAAIGITITGGIGALFWTVLPIILGALVSIVIGLATIAMRQALVALLIMISPLAFVCYLLPNTESWFKKWKDLLTKMLIFFPMFSLLFGASQLAGWAILSSSTDAFGIVLGLAVQVFPLFFSWSLMKMSGTILGTINQRLTGIAAKPLGSFSKFSDSQRIYRRQKYFASSASLGASARRYSDYRAKLQETDLENVKSVYDNNIQERVQRKLSSGYSASNSERNLRANKYTRNAKKALNAKMEAEIAQKDTAHVLDGYGKYFAKASPVDAAIGERAATNWLNYNRANFTATADEEADFDYLVDNYIRMNSLGPDDAQYQHYIKSVSPDGKFNVMGQLINKAATVEARRRRDYNTMIAKWNFDKRNFRNMVIGYYNNDDGLATDANGNKLGERQPGEFLNTDPSRLVLYDKKDENGRLYFDWYDQGKFVMRVYRDDSAFLKEAFSNFDTIINDPENALYGILSGINEGDIREPGRDDEYNARYKDIGLARYSTTLGRAILSAGYKEKNAAFSPYLAEMIKQRRIKNTVHMNIAMLDSLIKGAKAGNFVTMDQFSIRQFAYLLDPANYDKAFTDEGVDTYRNVNNDAFAGLDDAGNRVTGREPTLEEKKRKFQKDLLIPAMNLMLQMMTRETPNIRENQKESAAKALTELKASIDKWSTLTDDNSPLVDGVESNPYKQGKSSVYSDMAREIAGRLNSEGSTGPSPAHHYASEIEDIFRIATDPVLFADEITRYCMSTPELSGVLSQFEDFKIDNPTASVDEIYDYVLDLLRYFGLD